jgi:hypothetical protein
LKSRFNINDTVDDALLDVALGAASRQVDGLCGWRFWQDGSVVAREFRADDPWCVYVDEGISTTTGLIVKIDEDGDGTFETTLTITTDFLLEPLNAADMVPVWPYTEIRLVDNYSFPVLSNGRPGVQVTAKFGWPAVPDDVTTATLMLAADIHKSKDAQFGVAGTNDYGFVRMSKNSLAMALLAPYMKANVG